MTLSGKSKTPPSKSKNVVRRSIERSIGRSVKPTANQRAAAFAATAQDKAVELAATGKDKAAVLAATAQERLRDAHLDDRAAAFADRAQDLAAAAVHRLRDADLDDRAAELAERAQELVAQAVGRLRDADLDDRAAELAERAQELVAHAADRIRAADLDDKASALIDRVRRTPVPPAIAARRGVPRWLLVATAVLGAAGFLGLRSRRRESADDAFTTSAEHLASPPAATPPASTAPTTTAPTAKPLAEMVRTNLSRDQRTADLGDLEINVAEGTVFVRGSVPSGTDEDAIREVIANVSGVRDVDLQVATA